MIKGKNMIDYIFYGVTLTLFMVIAYIVNTFCLELKRLQKENEEIKNNINVIHENHRILVTSITKMTNALHESNEVMKQSLGSKDAS